MKILQDISAGWKARPVNTLARSLLAATLSLFISAGLWFLHRADSEADALLSLWPPDGCTLLFESDPPPELLLQIEKRLPAGSWFGMRVEEGTAWITGTLPSGFFDGRGISLPPEVISEGKPAALVQERETEIRNPGDLILHRESAFRVFGVGRFPLPAERLIPAKAGPPGRRLPEQIKVSRPASETAPLLSGLAGAGDFSLTDHREKQQEVRKGFHSLRRIFIRIALASAFLVAVLIQALSHAEIRERTSEFALRRSLGARPRDIRNQMLMETLVGSALPCLAGTVLFLPLVPGGSLAAAWAATLGWLMLCSSLPAFQASALPPGEALKGE